MFASQNREPRFSHPNSKGQTDEDSLSAQPTASVDFLPDNLSQHSSDASFVDYAAFPDYDELKRFRFQVPRASEEGSFGPFDWDGEHQQSLIDSIARFGVEEALDVNQLPQDAMPTTAEPWLLASHVPKSASRLSHHRESSLSSLGSAGPASPYTQTTANPHILVDHTSDSYQDLQGYESSHYQLGKPAVPLHDASLYGGYQDLGQSREHTASGSAQEPDRGLLSAQLALGTGTSHTSVSVANSAASDSPATPSLEMPGDERRRRAGEKPEPDDSSLNEYSPLFEDTAFNTVPKLVHSDTDAYNDQLWSPDFHAMSSSSANRITSSPTNPLFADRLNAVNHLNVAHGPESTQSRRRSPFRNGSPLAAVSGNDFPGSTTGPFRSAQQIREQTKMEQDARVFQQHVSRAPQADAPKTISPKDAVLEFREPKTGTNYPLFPPQDAMQFDIGVSQAPINFSTPATTASLGGQTHYAYSPYGQHHVLGKYPFARSTEAQQTGLLSRLGPSDAMSTDSTTGGLLQQKPAEVGNDGGTYTCTYHGCPLRFETPALLQKHKKERHRQGHGLNSNRRPEAGGASLLNSQAGPHRCDRINPSTGKPCGTVFSRPYDLTRHEDTIHNVRKTKVRCHLCTEEKTFSRADALTRHFRVCHPEVEAPGGRRRRAAAAR